MFCFSVNLRQDRNNRNQMPFGGECRTQSLKRSLTIHISILFFTALMGELLMIQMFIVYTGPHWTEHSPFDMLMLTKELSMQL